MSHVSLSPAKYAQQMKSAAVLDSPDATLDDLFRVADALGVSAADLLRTRENRPTGDVCGCLDDRCAGYHHDADLDHCPCADALAKDG